MFLLCVIVSVTRAGLIAAGHGALSSQSIVFGTPALGHSYAAAVPTYAASAYGPGLGKYLQCISNYVMPAIFL